MFAFTSGLVRCETSMGTFKAVDNGNGRPSCFLLLPCDKLKHANEDEYAH